MAQLAAAAADAARWPVEERRGVLEHLDRSIDGLTAVRATVLVAERESEAWRASGDRTFEAWRGRTSRSGQRSATVQVRQAEQLDAVPVVATAVTDGRIPLEHAAIIAKVAATGTPVQQRAASSRAGQEHLVGIAERQDAGQFATTTARWAATLDPAGLERDHQAQYAARFLHVVDTPRGTVIKGQVDSFAGHRLTLALEAVTPRPGPDDDRDPEQRRAAALDTIATRILGFKDTKPGANVPPQISLILTEETWVAAQADRDRRRRALATFGFRADDAGRSSAGASDDHGEGCSEGRHEGCGRTVSPSVRRSTGDGSDNSGDGCGDHEAELAAYPPATLEDGTPVPLSELAAAMCDCELTRIVIDALGAPLDLGRTERLFTGPQRRAVIARDRECAWPECHMHARWCQIHHMDWWQRDGGGTSVERGVLLCNFHHHEVHRQDLTIVRSCAPPPDSSPPRSRAPGSIARVSYEFRDPSGRSMRQSATQVPQQHAAQDPRPNAAERRPAGQTQNDRALAPPAQPAGTAGPGGTARPLGTAGPFGTAAPVASTAPVAGPALVARTAPEPPDDLDFTPTTDPVTGMTVPAFFLAWFSTA